MAASGRADLPGPGGAGLRAPLAAAVQPRLPDLELLAEIENARSGYRRAYRARKTWKELRRRGLDIGRDRVARVMRQNGPRRQAPRRPPADDDRR